MLAVSIAVFSNRKALIIGNAKYGKIALSNPINDAYEAAITLDELGFEVTLIQNANLKTISAVIDSFATGLSKSDEAFFYYNGFAAKDKSGSYLLPVGAVIPKNRDISKAGYNFLDLAKALSNAKSSALMFEVSHNKTYPGLSSKNMGLGPIEGIKGKQAILTSGNIHKKATLDVGRGRFTVEFMRLVRNSNDRLDQLASRAVSIVRTQTKNAQKPHIWYAIDTDFFINPPPAPVYEKSSGESLEFRRLPSYRSRFRQEGGGSYAF